MGFGALEQSYSSLPVDRSKGQTMSKGVEAASHNAVGPLQQVVWGRDLALPTSPCTCGNILGGLTGCLVRYCGLASVPMDNCYALLMRASGSGCLKYMGWEKGWE